MDEVLQNFDQMMEAEAMAVLKKRGYQGLREHCRLHENVERKVRAVCVAVSRTEALVKGEAQYRAVVPA